MPAPVASGGSESSGGPCIHWQAPPCHSQSSYFILRNINLLRHNIQILANMARTYGVAGARAAAGGADLRSLPLSERRKRLLAILPAKSPIAAHRLQRIGRYVGEFVLVQVNPSRHHEGGRISPFTQIETDDEPLGLAR